MEKRDKKLVKALIHSLGLHYQLSDDIIEQIVNSPDEFTAKTIRELDITEIESEEDLEKLKTNFYYMGLGKLHIPYYRVKTYLKRRSNKINLNKKWKNL